MRTRLQNSEHAFAEYMDRVGWTWKHHEQHGRHKPDFTVYRNGRAIAVIEVEDAMATKVDIEIRRELEEKGSSCRGYDPYAHIERAIKNAAKQLQGVEPSIPCMVVVADTLGKPSDEWAVLGAMFGAISLSLQLGAEDAEPKAAFGKGGKMVDPPPGDRGTMFLKENQRIGAVSYLKAKPVRALKAGYFADMKAICDRHDDLGDALQACAQRERHYRMHGVSPEDVEPCLEIYINPLSSVPWPADLHGQFDQVTVYSPLTNRFEMMFDGISEPLAKPLKKSATQQAIDEIMNRSDFRNEPS